MATSFPTLAQLDAARTDATQFAGGQAYGLAFTVDGKQYNFVPSNVAQNGGITAGNTTYLLPYFTSIDNLKNFGSNAQSVDLSSIGLTKYLESQGLTDKGYLIPSGVVPFDSVVNPVPTDTFGGDLTGLRVIDGQVAYGLSGGHGKRYATTTGEVHDPYVTKGGGLLGDLGQTIIDLGPIAPLLANIAMPGLGTAIAVGTTIGKGGSVEDLAKGYLASQIGSEIGADVGGVTGQIAGGTAAGLLSGQSPEDALKGSLVNTGVSQVAPSNLLTSSTGETNTSNTTQDNVPDIKVGQGTTGANNMADDYSYYGGDTTIPSNYQFPNTTIPAEDITGGEGYYDTGSAPMTQEQIDALTAQTYGGSNTFSSLDATTQAMLKKMLAAGGSAATTAQNFLKQNSGILSGGLSLAGNVLQSQADKAAALKAQQDLLAATGRATAGAQFRPVGITTRFGASQFQIDPATGQLVSAGYTAAPEITSAQNRLLSLGAGYLAQSPEDVAQQYMAKQYELLDPSRQRQLAAIRNQAFQTGRGGLSVGSTGLRPSGAQGLMGANPELEAYYNALAQQDAQLAAQAQQAGQQQVTFGTGLFGQAGQLEQLAQQPLTMGQALGTAASTAGANAGRLGLLGTGAAADYGVSRTATTNPYATVLGGMGSPTSTLGAGLVNWLTSNTPQATTGGAGGGITSPLMQNPTFDIYGSGNVPLGYANY